MSDIIAACGMNCSLCLAFQREKNKCNGCNSKDLNKRRHCSVCRIKFCDELIHAESKFCYSCKKFPCKRLKELDKRYKTKYGMSMLENLMAIKKFGINKFVKMEMEKWRCVKCGSLLCVHREVCQNCGTKK